MLWLLAEVAIAATDLAEVLGTIIALKLLFGMPMLWGCLVTALDTFVLLWLQKWGMRKMEAVILALVATIGLCFLVQIFMAQPDMAAVAVGLRPSLPAGSLVVAIGILGATVMPHNLYLHSCDKSTIATDRPERGEPGDRLPVQPDRLGGGAQCGLLRQRGDPGFERGGLPSQRGGGGEHRGSLQALALVSRLRRADLVRDRLALRRPELDVDRHARRSKS